ncbi:hypothetical protein LCGC14_0769640 [marine sediment metagenome]|uniref:DUF4177 domain-containing protein n=1 Tax=marine sediment metagenome TaxID=412755 RepID=A0A0F9QIL1_9ZZZZ
MPRYDYDHFTSTDLNYEEGTQQAPALVQYLRQKGTEGWHVVHFEGETDGEFFVLLEKRILDVG